MDSPNSGSLQSSSGGDDQEYDSRTPPASGSSFLNINSTNNFGHFSNHLSLLNPNHHHQEHTFFDPSQNFFHSFNSSPNLNTSLLNLDVPGSRVPLRPDFDCTKPTGSSMPNNAQLGPSQGGSAVPSMHLRSNGGRSTSPSDQAQGGAVPGRNPKKRTRASRRAPTTVLTTDTSNFRAMVQEFTGIPAPPFSGSPYTRRFDLFGSGMRSSGGHSEPVLAAASSLYPLRPSAQKVHQQIQSPFLFSSSSSSNSSSSSLMNNTNTNTTSSTSIPVTSTSTNFNPSTSSINYEHQNLLNMQNQMLSFHSLSPSISPNSSHLHHHHQHPSFNVPGLMNSKSILPFEEMGMGHNGWRDQGKLNSNSSDFHHEKGLENVPPRSDHQGNNNTVDSWICPSD